MKIVVVSGEDKEKARARYAQIIAGVKKKNWQINPITLGKATLAEQLVSTSLFDSEVLYILDGVKKLAARELTWLTKNADEYEGSLLIFANGKLPADIKKALPKSAQIETFEVPVLIWQFLDSFYPGNAKVCLTLLAEILATEAAELVIAMLARHLRDLYWARAGGKGMTANAWRAGKLKSQANKFTEIDIKSTIDSLAELDIRTKTSDVGAREMLELLIIERLG